MTFKTHNEFLAELNAMTLEDHLAVMTKYKLTPFKNNNETIYFSKYLVQGERKGLSATANVVQARLATTKLFNDFPHLLSGENDMTKATTKPVTAKATKVAKAKSLTQKVAKVKATHADGVVWFNADRNKFIVQINGDRAARPTAEACIAWAAKKFPDFKVSIAK